MHQARPLSCVFIQDLETHENDFYMRPDPRSDCESARLQNQTILERSGQMV